MVQKPRIVRPELLDDLAPTDPRARRSRRDFQRMHRAMGTVSILRRAIVQLRLAMPPTHVLELGAGDGTIPLRLAQALEPRWPDVSLTVLDRYDLLSNDTREGCRQLGWNLKVLRTDALSWAKEHKSQHYDLAVTTCARCDAPGARASRARNPAPVAHAPHGRGRLGRQSKTSGSTIIEETP